MNTLSFDPVLVDDSNVISERYGYTVLKHKTNKGKSCALKTGFKFIKEVGKNDGVVCADCDGQHCPYSNLIDTQNGWYNKISEGINNASNTL